MTDRKSRRIGDTVATQEKQPRHRPPRCSDVRAPTIGRPLGTASNLVVGTPSVRSATAAARADAGNSLRRTPSRNVEIIARSQSARSSIRFPAA
jgi:hypothetical protein